MKLLYSILAVGTLTTCAVAYNQASYETSGLKSLDESLFYATYALTTSQWTSSAIASIDKKATEGDMLFDSFDNALINGNVERALELMTSSSEIKDVVTSIKKLTNKIIHQSSILETSEDENWLKDFVAQDPFGYLAIRRYLIGGVGTDGTAAYAELLLKVLGVSKPVKTLAEAWWTLRLNRVRGDPGIRRAMDAFSQIVMSQEREIRSKKFCGQYWHGGARRCVIGKDLPISLLLDKVYRSVEEEKYYSRAEL